MGDNDAWKEWVGDLREGDADALRAFWDDYATPLLRLAGHNLQQRLRRRVDPEDVVQSALRTFLRRARDDEFELAGRDELWGLLCAITLNKARGQARFHSRGKRSLDREMPLEVARDRGAARVEPVSGEPTPLEAVALMDLIERVVSGARDEEEANLLLLRLDGFTIEEIAERRGCSERTVRRVLERVRTRLGALLTES